ncbi:MAG TPA: recombinase family protein, partial [Candidatus Acidoferrum sp.]|nr:recombinase family protein [Candidatus Acidoferrum sp.]
ARLMEFFEQHKVSFVSITQDFNTTTSLGRLTLNVLLSFAHNAERAIVRSHSNEMPEWRALQPCGASH